jgi:hypothetical protein
MRQLNLLLFNVIPCRISYYNKFGKIMNLNVKCIELTKKRKLVEEQSQS